MNEVTSGEWFESVQTEWWSWTIDMTTDQVQRPFGTVTDRNDLEVEDAAKAATNARGVVTEHYRLVLHLLRPDCFHTVGRVEHHRLCHRADEAGAAYPESRARLPKVPAVRLA